MATIYLIRHGQASFGTDDYDRLSPLGCRQAEVLGEYLRDSGIQLDVAYSGDLSRQRKTAELALASQASQVPHHIDPRLNEIRNDEQLQHLVPVVVESNARVRALVERGLDSSKDYQKVLEAVFRLWVSPGFTHPELQSWDDYSSAAHAALAQVMQENGGGKTVGVFTSGGTIATLVSHVLGLGSEHTYHYYEPLHNCSITRLFYSGTRVSLSNFNDSSYLQVLGQQRGENLLTYR